MTENVTGQLFLPFPALKGKKGRAALRRSLIHEFTCLDFSNENLCACIQRTRVFAARRKWHTSEQRSNQTRFRWFKCSRTRTTRFSSFHFWALVLFHLLLFMSFKNTEICLFLHQRIYLKKVLPLII
jgi:hypothetical protein